MSYSNSFRSLFVVLALVFAVFTVQSANATNGSHHSHSHHSYSVKHHHVSHGHGHWHWYRWWKKPACHTHSKAKPHLHNSSRWWSWRVFRHLRKHWRGSHHCDNTPQNVVPTASAGLDLSVAIGTSVTLDASASSDSDGTIDSYSWTQISGTAVTLNDSMSVMPTFDAPTVTVDTDLVFSVEVADNDAATASDTVTVTVEAPANSLPIISIVPTPATISALDAVTLDASGSSDDDGTIDTVEWVQTSGEPVALVGSGAVVSFTAPVIVAPLTSDLEFTVTVTDDLGGVSIETVSIALQGAVAPTVAINGVTTYQQDADPATDEEITLEAQVDDADSVSFIYLWEQVDNGAPDASIASPAGEETIVGLPDVLSETTFIFQLSVADETNLVGTEAIEIVVTPTIPLPISTISGQVTDVNGVALDAVDLVVFQNGLATGGLAQSGMNGEYSVELDAEEDYTIKFSKAGYADQVLVATSPAANGDADFNVAMIEVDTVDTITAVGSTTVVASDGAAVTFDKADFVDEADQVVTGDLVVSVTPVNVSQLSTSLAFPGLFAGVADGDVDPSPIASLGTVEFKFTQNGLPVNLAPGATADILIPIYTSTNPDTGLGISAGQTIALWSLDESTGIWIQEGVGTVVEMPESPTGFGLSATVTHFSWWNCDVTFNTAQVQVTVLGAGVGTAVISGSAELGSSNWRPSTVSTTVPLNEQTGALFIPSNREVCLVAEVNFDDGTNLTTEEECITAATNSLEIIELGTLDPGPVDVTVRPNSADDVSDVDAVIGFSVPVTISPLTAETSVTYEVIAGDSLPDGITLGVFNNRATLVGVATTIGNYSFTIRATDSDNETDDVLINYTVFDDSLDIIPVYLGNGDGVFQRGRVSESDIVNVSAYVGFRGFYGANGSGVLMAALVDSQETGVSYSTSGALPPGINSVESDSCCISDLPYLMIGTDDEFGFGVDTPTMAGNYSYTVNAQDNEGGQDSITFNISVLNTSPPPQLRQGFFNGEIGDDIDLNLVMISSFSSIDSGDVDAWSIVQSGDPEDLLGLCDAFSFQTQEQVSVAGPLPAGLSLNAQTGIMSSSVGVPFDVRTCVRGSNPSGASVDILNLNFYDPLSPPS